MSQLIARAAMMSFLTICFATITALLRFCPDTSLSRQIRTIFVERPCARIARFGRREVIYLMLLAGIMLFAGEMIAIAGSADFAFAYALDLSLYVDAALAAYAVSAATRTAGALKAIKNMCRQTMRKIVRRPRRKRSPSASPIQARPSNDDDGPWLRLAA
jgi:hypothetical protein